MNRPVFRIVVLLIVYLTCVAKAQQTTFKSLMPKANAATTIKPISETKKTTRSVITTTATSKPRPTNIPKYFVCRDTNSSAATGILVPYRNITSDEAKGCQFSIIAPPGQQIQISCSTMNLSSYFSHFRIAEYGEFGPEQDILVNHDYFSLSNILILKATFVSSDSFDCKWAMLPKDNTTNFKLCRHFEAKTANGTIEPLGGDTESNGICSISIVAPSDYQIEFSCSSLNFSGYLLIKGVLDGYSDNYLNNGMNGDIYVQVLGRKYYSFTNTMTVESSFEYRARFKCFYKAIPKEITTASKFCRHAEATAANGTISPIAGDTRPVTNCAFKIMAAPYQQIRIICPAISLASPESYLSIRGVNEDTTDNWGSIVNRTYYSTPGDHVTIVSYFGKTDQISCQWTTTTRENTTSLQICRDNVMASPRTASGTIEPSANMNKEELRSCRATISAPDGYQIQLSCSAVNMSSDNFVLRIFGSLDEEYHSLIEPNRVYTSNLYNRIIISSEFSQSDWFYCKWNIALREISPNSKLCRHAKSTATNGTLSPIAGNTGPMRECPFVIKGLPDQMLQISCSTLNFSTSAAYVQILGVIDLVNRKEDAIVNRVHTARKDNEIVIDSRLGSKDWIQCKWTTTTKRNTTDFKLCLDEEATSPTGSIQPLVGDITGPTRSCDFFIRPTSSDQQIQMSCSAVKLNNSSFEMHGAVDSLDSPLQLVPNRIYTTSSRYGLTLRSGIAKGDWIDCKWTTTPAKNTTDYKFCRDSEARTANGTIQPLTGDPGPLRECSFPIQASPNQQIQISCSTLKLTSPDSYFTIFGIIGTASPVILNRVYYSNAFDSYFINRIELESGVDKGDWIDCKWTTIPLEKTSQFKLCRHAGATATNGTITPIAGDTGPPRTCSFLIKAYQNQKIQISCSVLKLTSAKSYLSITGILEVANPPVLNRVYTSTADNDIFLSSSFDKSDTFNCSWTITPRY